MAEAERKAPIAKIRPWHEQIVDYLLENPGISQGAIAEELGKSEAWLSQIMCSDMFKAYYAARRVEFREQRDAEIIQMTQRLGMVGLEELNRRMATPEQRVALPQKELRETTKMALSTLYRGRETGNTNVLVEGDLIVARESIASAREKMRKLIAHNTIEGELADESEADKQQRLVSTVGGSETEEEILGEEGNPWLPGLSAAE